MIDECGDLSDVQKFYSGANILITGGTGFIGKLIVEKLLRTCWVLNKIYLIVRHKKGKTYEERLEDLFKSQAFGKLHEYNENFKEQVVLINGNMEEERVGLSKTDWDLLVKEINVVIHCAATVRFDEKIKKATYINVRATKDMVMLAHSMKNLKCFTYISTAYSHSYLKEIEEKVYDVHVSWQELLDFVEGRSDDELAKKTPELIGKWFNTYAFTKAIAEKVVAEEGEGLPRVIIRPTIVTSAVEEPHQGWLDTFYGPVSFSLMLGLGILHSFLLNLSKRVDFVPVDFVVNLTLAGTALKPKQILDKKESPISQQKDFSILTCSSFENPCTWRNYVFWAERIIELVPYEKSVWYNWYIFVSNLTIFNILFFILHGIPAYIGDIILKILGKEPILRKIIKKFNDNIDLLAPFLLNEWDFRTENTKALLNQMSYKDRRLFNFDIISFHWITYGVRAIEGARRYLLHEEINCVDDYRKGIEKRKWLKLAHYTVIAVLIYCLFYIIRAIYTLIL